MNLKEARKRRGWTQEQLALHADMTQAQISQIERRRVEQPSVPTMKALADALEMQAFYSVDQGLVFEERAS